MKENFVMALTFVGAWGIALLTVLGCAALIMTVGPWGCLAIPVVAVVSVTAIFTLLDWGTG